MRKLLYHLHRFNSEIKANGKKVVVTLEDSLKSTTYTIDFSDIFKINKPNVLPVSALLFQLDLSLIRWL